MHEILVVRLPELRHTDRHGAAVYPPPTSPAHPRGFVFQGTGLPRNKLAGKQPDKPMRDAILAALLNEISVRSGGKARKIRRLDAIADQLVSLAADGNLAAIREICDRIDGKATQPVAGDKDNPLLDVTAIKDALAKKLARLAQS